MDFRITLSAIEDEHHGHDKGYWVMRNTECTYVIGNVSDGRSVQNFDGFRSDGGVMRGSRCCKELYEACQ